MPFHRPLGDAPQGVVDFVRGGVALGYGDELHDGDGGRGDAVGDAVDDPLDLRDHQAHSTGGPGGGRDDVQRPGAGLAQVLAARSRIFWELV